MMDYDLRPFRDGLEELGLSADDNQTDQFLRFYEMLTETNKVMNLTAITDFQGVVTKHFLDSLSLVKALPGSDEKASENALPGFAGKKLIDIGTGAGFPGIPLKIMFPELEVTLLDSLNKRVEFLNDVIAELRLSSIQAVHSRAEDAGRNSGYREQYDICVSRAVADLAVLAEYCLPFVKRGGFFIPYKTSGADRELENARAAIAELGGSAVKTVHFVLPGGENGRSLIIIEKTGDTPGKYPRKAGKPARKPLGKQ